MRPVRIAELQSKYVDSGSRGRGVGLTPVDAFLCRTGGRMAEPVFVTACGFNDVALDFYVRHGIRPKSVTLEMAL